MSNSVLQAAHLVPVPQAPGLDSGPNSRFDAARVNTEFFPDGALKTDFLTNLGHSEPRLTASSFCTLGVQRGRSGVLKGGSPWAPSTIVMGPSRERQAGTT
jgi:hypothetical protein